MTRSIIGRRATVVALIGTLLVALTGCAAPAPEPSAARDAAAPRPADRPADPIAHDPTMVRQGGWYYVAITGDGGAANTFIPMKRSRDLVHWQEIGPVFTSLPTWVVPALGVEAADAPKDLWAPDLSFANGEWRLYYTASVFGKNSSVIGLATTRSLDPASPQHGWKDRGPVLKSTDYRAPGGDSFNALDPNIVRDADGGTWLSYGSFFSGIFLHRIDARTGTIPTGDAATHLAQRAEPNAEENATIVHHGGYYYLFLAFDSCCRGVEGDYRTVVARSKAITGPYVDRAGVPMLDDKGGTELMRGYNEFVGAGGADVLIGEGGRDLVVNHYYDATDKGAPRLNVRRLAWGADGWPRVGDPVNPSRSAGHGDAYVDIRPSGATTVVENAGCGYEGARIALFDDLGNLCQQWQVSDRGSGSRITNRFSNQVVENAGCKNVDGGPLAQWGWLGYQDSNDCQRWSFGAAPGGSTTISTVQKGGRSWTAAASTAAGTDVVIDRATGAADQRFLFQPVQPVLLGSPAGGMTTLGVAGSRVRFQPRSPRAPQIWRFERIGSSGRYHVVSTADGRWLAASPKALRVVRPGAGSPAASAWTLRPTDDGTWSLANAATTQRVRLLLP